MQSQRSAIAQCLSVDDADVAAVVVEDYFPKLQTPGLQHKQVRERRILTLLLRSQSCNRRGGRVNAACRTTGTGVQATCLYRGAHALRLRVRLALENILLCLTCTAVYFRARWKFVPSKMSAQCH
jgi:hypothetical protein